MVRLSTDANVIKNVVVAEDKTKECVYIGLEQNYSDSTKIILSSTEICKSNNSELFSTLLKSISK
jgi:hypothetical protein